MARVILLLLVATISVSGQDSILVGEYCQMLRQFSDTAELSFQVSSIDQMMQKFLERSPIGEDNTLQGVIRFKYRLFRDVRKTCPSYASDRITLLPKPVLDLEGILTKQQVDSLGALAVSIEQAENAYLHVVTIDNFYPDSTIADFANRYREFWAPRTRFQKGIVLLTFSKTHRQVRVSTGGTSMNYLTDEECSEVNKVMTPYFRDKRYYDGLVNGLLAIKSKL